MSVLNAHQRYLFANLVADRAEPPPAEAPSSTSSSSTARRKKRSALPNVPRLGRVGDELEGERGFFSGSSKATTRQRQRGRSPRTRGCITRCAARLSALCNAISGGGPILLHPARADAPERDDDEEVRDPTWPHVAGVATS
jgi:hypothetical protein